MIEPLRPYFVEDLVRSENPGVYRHASQTGEGADRGGRTVRAEVGLERTDREHLTDYARATIPNVGGITEFMKIAGDLRDALCRPRSALHGADFGGGDGALLGGVFWSGADGDGDGRDAGVAVLAAVSYDLKNGKLWPNERPGYGRRCRYQQAATGRRL